MHFSVISWAASFLRSCPVDNVDVKVLASYLGTGDFRSYLNYALTTSSSHPDFPIVYQCANLLKKYPCKGFTKMARLAAVTRFWEAEETCRETNLRVARFAAPNDVYDPILKRAAHHIRRVLGDGPRLVELLRDAEWTTGVDSANPYGFTSSYQKYAVRRPQVTPEALDLAQIFINANPRWAARVAGANHRHGFHDVCVTAHALDVVAGNRVSFVPKNAKTDRSIAVEPHMNVYMQRAVGVAIRRRLLRFGVDLRDQTRNQDLAMIGSATNDIVTIDLSMASDSLSVALVERLLPPKWFHLLNKLRSKVGIFQEGAQQREFVYHKFSSMGNGFTFELETLIFWALARACGPKHAQDPYLSVYGDDIITSVGYAPLLIDVLQYCGFETNREKTFLDGPFRESCGKDYLNGTNIRPFFIREEILPHHRRALYKLANALRDYSGCTSHNRDIRNWLKSHYDLIVVMIPRPHRVPASYGADQGLHSTLQESQASFSRRNGWWTFSFLKPEVNEEKLFEIAKERGRSARRADGHLLMLTALRRVVGSSENIRTPEPASEPDEITLDVSPGSPIRYVTVVGRTSSWKEPVLWN